MELGQAWTSMLRALGYDQVPAGSPMDLYRKDLSRSGMSLLSSVKAALGYSAQTAAYQENAWIHACVSKIGTAAGMLKLRFWTGEGNDREEVTSGRIYDTFNPPNPMMSQYDFWEYVFSSIEIAGNAYAIYDDENDCLYPLYPDRVTPVVRGSAESPSALIGYLYQKDEESYRIPPKMMIHLKAYNPRSFVKGLSKIEVARKAIEVDGLAQEYALDLLEEGGELRGVMETDQFLSNAEYQRILQRWRQAKRVESGTKSLLILERGMSYNPIALNPGEVQWLQTRQMSLEEIAAIFSIAQSQIIGSQGGSYKANVAERAAFWEDTMVPKVHRVEGGLSMRMPAALGSRKFTAEFDLNSIRALRSMALEETSTKLARVKAGAMTINEMRRLEGDTPLPWGDYWWGNVSTVPLASVDSGALPSMLPSGDGDGNGMTIINLPPAVDGLSELGEGHFEEARE